MEFILVYHGQIAANNIKHIDTGQACLKCVKYVSSDGFTEQNTCPLTVSLNMLEININLD